VSFNRQESNFSQQTSLKTNNYVLPEWNSYGEEIGYFSIIFKFLSFHLKPSFVYKMLSRTYVHGVTLAEKLPQKL